MKSTLYDEQWPESWKLSWQYDQKEFGVSNNIAYTHAYKIRAQTTIEMIKRKIAKGGMILDVAAAQGNFSLALAELGYQVTWNDLRDELVDYVKLKYEYGEICYRPGNILELDFDQLFDCVLIAEVIEHVAYPDKFLKQISKLVKPTGFIVLSTPNGEYIRNQLPKFSSFTDPAVFESVQFQPDANGHIFLLYEHEIYMVAQQAGLAVKELHLQHSPFISAYAKVKNMIPILPTPSEPLATTIDNGIARIPWLKHKLSTQIIALLTVDG